jgi:hypothetical protein
LCIVGKISYGFEEIVYLFIWMTDYSKAVLSDLVNLNKQRILIGCLFISHWLIISNNFKF